MWALAIFTLFCCLFPGIIMIMDAMDWKIDKLNIGKDRPVNTFKVGDWVKLRDKNPFKGAIRTDRSYEVMRVGITWIGLLADNGTTGGFDFQHFEIATRGVDHGAVEEYEQAMKAYDLLGL